MAATQLSRNDTTENSNEVRIYYVERGLCNGFPTSTNFVITSPGDCFAVFAIKAIDNRDNSQSFTFVPPQLYVQQAAKSFVYGQSSQFSLFVAGPFGVAATMLPSKGYISYNVDALAAALVRCKDNTPGSRTNEDFQLLYDTSDVGVAVTPVKIKPAPPFWANVGNCKVFTGA